MARRNGFTLLELLVVISLVAVLAGKLLQISLDYREKAEREAVQQMLASIHVGLQMQLAAWLLRGQYLRIRDLPNRNPISVLVDPPGNYGGLVPPGAALERGKWYYDEPRRELVYRPFLDAGLRVEGSDEKLLRFRVELVGEEKEVADDGRVAGVRLVPVKPFTW